MHGQRTELVDTPLATIEGHAGLDVRRPWDAHSWISFAIATGFGVAMMSFVVYAFAHAHPH